MMNKCLCFEFPAPRVTSSTECQQKLHRSKCPMGLFKFVTGFAVGVYTGLYISKNYNVPDVPGPDEIKDKLMKLAEEYKKDKPDK